MKLELDYSKKAMMHITNDAFNYLYFEEEPLDDANMAEAEEIVAMYPLGFSITEYDFLDDSGMVVITILPYVETDFVVNIIIKMFNGWVYECERTGNNLRYRRTHDKIGPQQIKETKVRVNQYRNEYFVVGDYDEEFISGKNSMFFLSGRDVINV